MPRTLTLCLLCFGLAGLPPLAPAAAPDAAVLTLSEAERLAIQADPAVSRYRQLAAARQEQAVADGQLPDPKLKLGMMNLPTDTFNRSQEAMTQLQVGLVQVFPRGDTRALKRRQTDSLAAVELARSANQRRLTVRGVRDAWLELWYQLQARKVLRTSRQYFAQLVDITQAQYAAGRSNQQDVISAHLELARLDDRETRILTARDQARAQLAKWIGTRADAPLPETLPGLPPVSAPKAILAALPEHPRIAADNARIQAGRRGVDLAKEQYRPGLALDVTYGFRDGEDPDGSSRADFLSAMVLVDLPLFTSERQDRRYAASQKRVFAAQDARDDRLRELKRVLEAEYAKWRRSGERLGLYRNRLVPDAQANAEAALRAYQSGVSEFITLMRARIADLDARLQALRLQVDQAQAQARLLYLAREG